MPNVYQPYLIQVKPQYSVEVSADVPENILWVTAATGGPYSKAALANAAAVFDPLWALCWAELAYDSASYTGSVWTDWTNDVGNTYTSVGTYTPSAGTGGTGLQGAQVSALISWSIPYRYKGGHPRTYLPWIAGQSLTDTGDITNSLVINIGTHITSLISSLLAASPTGIGNMELGTYRFRTDASKAMFVSFTSGVLRAKLATQRRRLRRITRS